MLVATRDELVPTGRIDKRSPIFKGRHIRPSRICSSSGNEKLFKIGTIARVQDGTDELRFTLECIVKFRCFNIGYLVPLLTLTFENLNQAPLHLDVFVSIGGRSVNHRTEDISRERSICVAMIHRDAPVFYAAQIGFTRQPKLRAFFPLVDCTSGRRLVFAFLIRGSCREFLNRFLNQNLFAIEFCLTLFPSEFHQRFEIFDHAQQITCGFIAGAHVRERKRMTLEVSIKTKDQIRIVLPGFLQVGVRRHKFAG